MNQSKVLSWVGILLTTFVGMYLLKKYSYIRNPFSMVSQFSSSNATTSLTVNAAASSTVLLIYVYANVHEYAYGNLKYFIENAVRERDGVDYIFILQQTDNKPIDESRMPPIPASNAFYFQHENRCFDYGTIGWFLDQYTIGNPWRKATSTPTSLSRNSSNRLFDLAQYRYFILMNSSVRGPFLPPYFLKFMSDYQTEHRQPFPWYNIFTKRLSKRVKLVGSTINCNPTLHVQSYLLTTDFAGMSLLLKDSTSANGRIHTGVFGCYGSKSDTTVVSELGISTLLLDSGYRITSLMAKHQLIEFANKTDSRCQVWANPYADKSVDGTSLEPYDVVFVKFNARQTTIDAQERAKMYQRWMEETKANKTS